MPPYWLSALCFLFFYLVLNKKKMATTKEKQRFMELAKVPEVEITFFVTKKVF